MILSRIELKYIGPFRESVAVGPFDTGFNLISAPNEAGKSTCLRAVARGLFDRHTTKDDAIKSFVPSGTALAPSVTLEFQIRDRQYRIEKTFLRGPCSLLLQRVETSWKPIAEGDEADRQIQKLLNSTLPGRGATTPTHWGLFGFLWARQGEPSHWPSLHQSGAGQLIRQRLARIEIDPVVTSIQEEIRRIADEGLSATGKIKTRSVLGSATGQLETIEKRLKEIKQTRERLDVELLRYQESTETVARLEVALLENQKRLGEFESHMKQSEKFIQEFELTKMEFKSIQDRFNYVRKDFEQKKTYTARNSQLLHELKEATTAVNQHSDVIEENQTHLVQVQQKADILEKRLTDLRLQHPRIQQWIALVNDTIQLDRLIHLETQAKQVDAQLKSLQETHRHRFSSLSRESLSKLERFHEGIHAIDLEIKAQGISVELTPNDDRELLVDDHGVQRLKKGVKTTFDRPQILKLQLKDWGEVSVRSGSKAITELMAHRNEIEARFNQELNRLGVTSIADARETLEQKTDLEKLIAEMSATLRTQLGEFKSIAELGTEVATCRQANIDKLFRIDPIPEEQSRSLETWVNQETQLKQAIQEIEIEIRPLQETLKEWRQRVEVAKQRFAAAEKITLDTSAQLKAVQDGLEEFSKHYPDGLEKGYHEIEQAFAETRAIYRAAEAKLPQENSRERYQEMVETVKRIAGELERARRTRDEATGALATLGSEGIYSQETDLLELKNETEQQVTEQRTTVWAARHLHFLLEQKKQSATQSILAPLEAKLTSLFAELSGITSRKVFLDENLSVAGIGETREESHPFEWLSQGAKEQLLLCLRMAVAEELAVNEPQTLILDDSFVNTDSNRHERLLKLLIKKSNALQMIVMTCHPERWSQIPGIKRLSIEPATSNILLQVTSQRDPALRDPRLN
jgi:DNA repair exonuclease SbcCD ATPase subunit